MLNARPRFEIRRVARSTCVVSVIDANGHNSPVQPLTHGPIRAEKAGDSVDGPIRAKKAGDSVGLGTAISNGDDDADLDTLPPRPPMLSNTIGRSMDSVSPARCCTSTCRTFSRMRQATVRP